MLGVRRRTSEPRGRRRRRLKFLVDAQLPPALARWLRDQGYQAAHVQDVGLRDAEDGPIEAHALGAGAVIVTKDDDYAARAARMATPAVATSGRPPQRRAPADRGGLT